MNRRRRLVLGATALAVAAAVVLAVVLAPLLVKAGLAAAVAAKTGRQLQIEGTPALGFWPRLTIGLGPVSLSEKDAAAEFAHLDGARISLAPLPLLAGRVVADSIELTGPAVTIVRRADGSLNIDDLLASKSSGTLQLEIAAVKVAGGRLTWRDEKAGTTSELTDIGLTADGIRADTAAHAFGIETAALALRYADAAATLEIAGAAAADGRLQAARLGLALDGRFGEATVKGRLESPLTADLAAGSAQLPKIAGRLAASHPRLPMKSLDLPITAAASLDLAKPAARLDLATVFDGAKVDGRLAVERFSPLRVDVELAIDRLDLDRYQNGSSSPAASDGAAASPPAGIDLHGAVKVGSLRMGGLTATDVVLRLGD